MTLLIVTAIAAFLVLAYFGAPILWYLARIELPGGRVLAGATAPGFPLIVIGRNERLAWGFTTTHSDTQDVFVEHLAAGSPDAYETPDGPQPFVVREEVIRVGSPFSPAPPREIRMRVRETRHGPVISDLDAPDGQPDGTVMAGAMTQPTGQGQPHENRQPFMGANYCIAIEGIYPSRP